MEIKLVKEGYVYPSYSCGEFKIIKVLKREALIKFINTGSERVAALDSIRRGSVKDFYKPNVCGVGFIGGDVTSGRGKLRSYSVWRNIIQRCYNEKCVGYKFYGGSGVTVNERWLNYQEFAKWYDEHYLEGFDLDKDLKVLGSKVYSQDTCSFIPKELNKLLTNHKAKRGDHPVGVTKLGNRFVAQLSNPFSKKRHLGCFETATKAFSVYKDHKEFTVKKSAQDYYNRGEICEAVYNNLMNWEAVPYPE